MRKKGVEKNCRGQKAASAPVNTVSRGGSQLVTLQRSVYSLAGVLAEDPSVFLCSANIDGVSLSIFMAGVQPE